MRMQGQSLALLSGLRIQCSVSYGVGHRFGSDLALLWLWYRPAVAAPIWPLAQELPYAAGKKKDSRNLWGKASVLLAYRCELFEEMQIKCFIYWLSEQGIICSIWTWSSGNQKKLKNKIKILILSKPIPKSCLCEDSDLLQGFCGFGEMEILLTVTSIVFRRVSGGSLGGVVEGQWEERWRQWVWITFHWILLQRRVK